MFKFKLLIGCCGCLLGLSACTLDGIDSSDYYWNAPPRTQDNSQVYPEGYDTIVYDNSARNYRTPRQVAVPDSYHLGINNTPVASKDDDKNWIDGQNPQGYTIEVAEDNKPAAVAKTLQKAPKSERSAEVKSQRGAYIGVYGSYPSKEAAESKLNSLPDDIKQNAKIKNWQTIQNDVGH